jgi:hypothetical protein
MKDLSSTIPSPPADVGVWMYELGHEAGSFSHCLTALRDWKSKFLSLPAETFPNTSP